MVLAGVVFLLFVLPAVTQSGQAIAQEPPPPGGPAMGGPPMGPGGPAMDGPPMGPGMGPGGPPMDPGMGPGMGPGGPPGMGMEGMDGAGAPMVEDTGSDVEPAKLEPPLERSRSNPFSAPGVVVGPDGVDVRREITSYGTNWSRLPITARVGFVRPNVPPPSAAAPPAPSAGPDIDLRVTSIMWTQDGQALAVYESGTGAAKKSGVVKPGERVDNWEVVEIWRDRVVVADTKTGARKTVYMTTGESAPAPAAGAGQGGRGGRGTNRRPPTVTPGN